MFDLFKRKPKTEANKIPENALQTEVVAEHILNEAVVALDLPTPAIETTSMQVFEPTSTDSDSSITVDETIIIEQAQAIAEPIEQVNQIEPAQTSSTEAIKESLSKSFFARTFGGLFSRNPKLDPELLDELEATLITADVGVNVSGEIMAQMRKRFKAREFANVQQLLNALRQQLYDILVPVSQPLIIDNSTKPFVLLTVGINGAGKTTSIGKLARRFQQQGHSLMLAAGDTFRAAAVQQIQIWGERNNVAVISQGQDADPASVAFDALQAAKARGYDLLIVDTAGRLHTQTHLMAELSKIKRVLSKIDASAPHEVLLIIDGTTGQNAINQCRAFNEAVGVTGLIVTKLDGTAKGGILFALAREFGIPIRFIGLGEKPEDLRSFDPKTYVDALLPQTL